MEIKYDKNIFAKNLQRLMDANGKSRRDICDDLGFSYYTFTDWIKARKFPRIDKLEMLADYFGIEKSDLIEEKEKSTKNSELSENKKKLMQFIECVPEDKTDLILRVLQSIVEDEK